MSGDPAESEFLWEFDETKRYPSKDPPLLTEFEKRYPFDPVGQEASENARVWRVYQDRMKEMDEDTIAAWNDSINFLLIFAGLFSAVLTAFVIESSKQLERDPAEATTQILVALLSHFNGSEVPSRSQLDPDHFVAPASARVTNAFWFVSLALSLIVSMLSILAKQWITMFSSRMRAPVASLRRWAHRHRVFRDGFDRWRLDAFISSLSVALHGAVLLFLTGLNIHLFPRDIFIFGLVFSVTALAAVFYVGTTVAPLYDGSCPTATPLLIHSRIAFIAIMHTLCHPFGARTRDLENGSFSPSSDKPSFDPDVVLDSGDDNIRDARILVMMATDLPAGHDVDVALDAIGGLCPQSHQLAREELKRVRNAARSRLERLCTSVGASAADAAAVARSIRSSINIEADIEVPPWKNFRSIVPALRSIRTHDVFPLSVALEQQQLNRSPELNTRWLELQSRRLQPWIHTEPLSLMGIMFDTQSQHVLRHDESLWWKSRLVTDILEPMARWNLHTSPGCSHPVPLTIRAMLLEEIGKALPDNALQKPPSTSLCATIVLGFSGEPSLRQRCHELITPLVISALELDFHYTDINGPCPPWRPLPESIDWRLRTIDVWAHAASHHVSQRAKISMAAEAYADVLSQWQGISKWPPLPTSSHLTRIVLPAGKLALPASARATLWDIGQSTCGFDLDAEIFRIILHGVSPDDMLTLRPDIADSVAHHVLWWLHLEDYNGHVCPAENLVDFSKHHLLLAALRPFVPMASSGSTTPTSVWRVISPYLEIASIPSSTLAEFMVRACSVLTVHTCMADDTGALFEELLGSAIGHRIMLSREHRKEAFIIARHAYLFATEWWENMRSELTTGATHWKPTREFETATAFLKVVEDSGPCLDCVQIGCVMILDLEEKKRSGAWIEHTERNSAAAELCNPRSDLTTLYSDNFGWHDYLLQDNVLRKVVTSY